MFVLTLLEHVKTIRVLLISSLSAALSGFRGLMVLSWTPEECVGSFTQQGFFL